MRNLKKKIVAILSVFLFLQVHAAEVSQAQIQRYSTYYANGMQCFKNKQYGSAIVEFKKVLRFSPYDTTVQEALTNAYLEKAKNYKNVVRDNSKALINYKNACFYAKYWKNSAQSQNMANVTATCLREIAELERKLQLPQDEKSKLQRAKILKAQGELAAAGYNFHMLTKGTYKEEAFENLGNIYKNLNNISAAMDYYKTAIDNDPKNAKLHFLYGVMLDEAKNYEASMEQYNLALQYGDKSPELLEILENKWRQDIANNPNYAQSYINLGVIYQKQGNLEAAKNQYLRATQLDVTDNTALLNLASLYMQQKNYQSAIDAYNRLLARNPNNIEVIKYKITALKQVNRWDEALRLYETAIKLSPQDAVLKAEADNLVMSHFSGEKLQNYLISKAQADSKNYEAQFNCALELHKNKNYKEALKYYQKAQALNPSKEEVYLNLAQIYIEQKDFKSSIDICQKGLMMLPNSSKLLQYLKEAQGYSEGQLYTTAAKLYEQKNYKEALNNYLKIENKTTDVKMMIASCYWSLNDYNSANKYYLEILAKEPNNIEALTNSAYAYYSLKDYNSAKAMADKILTYNKTNKDALSILSDIKETQGADLLNNAIEKHEQGKYQESLAILDKLLMVKPNDDWAIYYRGLNYDELKNPTEAIKQYRTLISKNPEFYSAYYSLAVDLDNLENYQEAINYYQMYLSKTKENNEMTTFSASRIKELKDYLNKLNASK